VNGIVPIGRPHPGLGVLIVDDDLKAVRPGEIGELCVCGPQAVPGYWQDPVRTEDRFISLPVSALTSLRFYRTGDRVARLPSGDYVYIGRTDNQIKVLGHRVELGEIEAALRRNPGVVHAIALGWPVVDGTSHGIVAFVCGTGIAASQLQQSVRAALPEYMVPREVFVVEEMPFNANGKADRNALRQRLDADVQRKPAEVLLK
jgi:acyl-coenzyme A synthetase/AMP-(fatty) acid ligase